MFLEHVGQGAPIAERGTRRRGRARLRAGARAFAGRRRGAQRLCHRVHARRQELPRGGDAGAGGQGRSPTTRSRSTTLAAPTRPWAVKRRCDRGTAARRCDCGRTITSPGSGWPRCSKSAATPSAPYCNTHARSRTHRKQGRWLDAAGHRPALQRLVERGVAGGAHASPRRAARTAGQARDEIRPRLARARRARRADLPAGAIAAEYPDPRQQPTFLYVPGVPADAVFRSRAVSVDRRVRGADGRDPRRIAGCPASEDGRERVFTTDDLEQQNLRGEAGPAELERLLLLSAWRAPRRQLQPLSPQRSGHRSRCRCRDVPGHGPEVLYLSVHAGHAPAAASGRHQFARCRPSAADRSWSIAR